LPPMGLPETSAPRAREIETTQARHVQDTAGLRPVSGTVGLGRAATRGTARPTRSVGRRFRSARPRRATEPLCPRQDSSSDSTYFLLRTSAAQTGRAALPRAFFVDNLVRSWPPD